MPKPSTPTNGQPSPAGRFPALSHANEAPRRGAPWHLLPFLVAALLVVAALHLVSVMVNILVPPEGAAPASPSAASRSASTSSPTAVAAPLRRQQPVGITAPAQRNINAPAFPHNLRFGSASSPHTLTIFTDPACAACNVRLARQLAAATTRLSGQLSSGQPAIVVKYWPAVPDDLTPGLLVELARRHGVAEAYWQALTHRTQPTSTATLFAELERLGINLTTLRAELEQTSPDLVSTVVQDVQQGRQLRLPPPPAVILNGQLLP